MTRKYSFAEHLLPAGLRVLAVEDETLIALDLQDMLMGSGAGDVIVARDFNDVERVIADDSEIDVAIINLNPAIAETDVNTARVVQRSGIPFLFATGNGPPAAGEFSDAIFVTKPYTREIIVAAVLATLDRAGPDHIAL